MPLEERNCAVTYKVLVLGHYSVGKTALLDNLTGHTFRDTMAPTVGVDFVRKIFEVDGALVQLLIWDSPGQERFRSITRQQYRGVQGLVLVYDVTNSDTFETLQYWLRSIEEEMSPPTGGYEPIPFVICGNKTDLSSHRKVTSAKGTEFSDRHMAFGFFETSAKTGENVYSAFHTLAFNITDICDPKLMKSYHPYLLRPVSLGVPRVSSPSTQRKSKLQARTKTKRTRKLATHKDGAVAMDARELRVVYAKDETALGSLHGTNFSRGGAGGSERKSDRQKEERGEWGCVLLWCCSGKKRKHRL
ncbi:ras-related protein Rab-10 [Aplysia californica]|uniref:Ras-related protein Rab-10 n=1 Tax=Aplysia californica TaxID=6500 RepID=A0ABM1A7M5_APLCA|nr:ras-related protein Rab-10 [Aplysia californica]